MTDDGFLDDKLSTNKSISNQNIVLYQKHGKVIKADLIEENLNWNFYYSNSRLDSSVLKDSNSNILEKHVFTWKFDSILYLIKKEPFYESTLIKIKLDENERMLEIIEPVLKENYLLKTTFQPELRTILVSEVDTIQVSVDKR